jgi:lysyl-tRNA synthetase class 2
MRRAAMLKRARDYFEQRNILEVDTPILSRFAISDPHIESVEASLQLDAGRSWFLRTSPEYCMKRLLSAGYPNIYEIGKVFRDGEFGRRHQPEFTMVEWYRLDFSLKDIMQDTVDFIGKLIDTDRFEEPPVYMSYARAFSDFAGIDYTSVDGETLDLMLAEKVSPQFASNQMTLLYHYPASQAALARICPDDDSVADRFEVFVGQLELANGYVELIDAKEQIQRFQIDQSRREAAGQIQRPIDGAFVAALESGLPACAGVAVGFDRVHMLNEGVDDIRQVLNFSFDHRDEHG